MVPCASCSCGLSAFSINSSNLLGRYSASYPESNADRLFAKLWVCLPPDHFGSKHHLGNTVSLLCGEQTEGISEHNGYTAISIVILSIRRSEPSVGDYERHKAKVGLCFTAACRKVKQGQRPHGLYVSDQRFRQDSSE